MKLFGVEKVVDEFVWHQSEDEEVLPLVTAPSPNVLLKDLVEVDLFDNLHCNGW